MNGWSWNLISRCRTLPALCVSALTLCMDPGLLPPPDASILADATLDLAKAGLVDDVGNLMGANVYIYSGKTAVTDAATRTGMRGPLWGTPV
jgi:hypothetical protein